VIVDKLYNKYRKWRWRRTIKKQAEENEETLRKLAEKEDGE